MPTAVELPTFNVFHDSGPIGGGSLRVDFGKIGLNGDGHASELSFFSASEVTEDQINRATAKLAAFCQQLPEDERQVISNILLRAAEASDAIIRS
jgi:hypothetical protein